MKKDGKRAEGLQQASFPARRNASHASPTSMRPRRQSKNPGFGDLQHPSPNPMPPMRRKRGPQGGSTPAPNEVFDQLYRRSEVQSATAESHFNNVPDLKWYKPSSRTALPEVPMNKRVNGGHTPIPPSHPETRTYPPPGTYIPQHQETYSYTESSSFHPEGFPEELQFPSEPLSGPYPEPALHSTSLSQPIIEEPEPSVSAPSIEETSNTLMHLLHCSPLMMWTDMNQTAIFLMSELPKHATGNTLDLIPFWNHLQGTPGLPESTLFTFFEEIHRQTWSWDLIYPREFKDKLPQASEAALPEAKAYEQGNAQADSGVFPEWQEDEELQNLDLDSEAPASGSIAAYSISQDNLPPVERFGSSSQRDLQSVRRKRSSLETYPDPFEEEGSYAPPEETYQQDFAYAHAGAPDPHNHEPQQTSPGMVDPFEYESNSYFGLDSTPEEVGTSTPYASSDWLTDIAHASSEILDAVSQEPEVDPVEECSNTIMGALHYSPLMMWIDLNQVAVFLMSELPTHIQNNQLDLTPMRDFLMETPGIQESAIQTFFEELGRQEFPLQLKMPRPIEDTKQQEPAAPKRMGTRRQPRQNTNDPLQRLKRRTPKKTKRKRKSSIYEYAYNDPFAEDEEDKPVKNPPSVEWNAKAFESSELQGVFSEQDLDAVFTELESSAPQSAAQASPVSQLPIPERGVSSSQGLDTIMMMLASSPLALWVDLGSFQLYLERRLSEYVFNHILDLEPLWENLHRIPGVQGDAVVSFLIELSRQPLPWRLCLPKNVQQTAEFAPQSIISRSALEAAQAAKKQEEEQLIEMSEPEFIAPEPLIATPGTISQGNPSTGEYGFLNIKDPFANLDLDNLAASMPPKKQKAQQGAAAPPEVHRQPTKGKSKSVKPVKASVQELDLSPAPQKRPGLLRKLFGNRALRISILMAMLIGACVFLFMNMSKAPDLGASANAKPYKKYMNIIQVFKKRQTMSIVLKGDGKARGQLINKFQSQVENKIDRQQIRKVRVYSKDHKLLFTTQF